ncbi:MAG: alpha-amylase family glycosyl hydrolase [Cryomorphaceae bacterium]
MKTNLLFFSLLCSITLIGCGGNGSQPANEPVIDSSSSTTGVPELNAAPHWAGPATMYEVNVRQYSKEGTLNAFSKSIPRLKNMGVDILWFMPVQPIGIEHRKGELGSYYSISDYTAVNPEFGSLEDFKKTVDMAHSMGMKVILDWVANHSAFDNQWAKDHPEWYTQDSLGNIIPPNPDWSDVADLNYDNQDMRRAMIDAMKFWIVETDIDGFRCDVAGEVPLDFWDLAIEELRAEKEVFMLAEWDEPWVHSSFNASYAWGFHHQLMEIGKGHYTLDSLRNFLVEEAAKYDESAFKLRFTTNHDENTWKGSEKALFGDLTKNFQALMYAVPGMPLMYSGQESVLEKRLKFFEKDEIDWKRYELADFFSKLNEIKDENPALHGGEFGGSFTFLGDDSSNGIMAFDRVKGENKVRFIMNCTPKAQDISAYLDSTPNDLSLMDGKPFTGPELPANDFVILQMND